MSKTFSVFDCGRIINKGAGTNQMLGATVMGVGMALFEDTIFDHVQDSPSTTTSQTISSRLVQICRSRTSLSSTIPTTS